MGGSKNEPGEDGKIPAAARPSYEAVVALTDAFCREYLTDEYEALCRKLAGALARKRPSPLLKGGQADDLGVRDRPHDRLGQLPRRQEQQAAPEIAGHR